MMREDYQIDTNDTDNSTPHSDITGTRVDMTGDPFPSSDRENSYYSYSPANYSGTSEPDTDQPHHRQQPGSVEDEDGFRCYWQARMERVEQHQRNLIPRPPAQPPH